MSCLWNVNTAHIAWDYNLRLLGGVLNNKKKERSLHFPLFHFWNLTGSKFKELAFSPLPLQETIPLGLSGTTGFIIHSQTAREIKGNFKLTGKLWNLLAMKSQYVLCKFTCKWAVFNCLKGNWLLIYIFRNVKEGYQIYFGFMWSRKYSILN